MLDLLGILFSSIMMFLVILRAIQLDSTQPWFRPSKMGGDRTGLQLKSERRNPGGWRHQARGSPRADVAQDRRVRTGDDTTAGQHR